ncbi:hypothetical protein COO91_01485 [Nostoc flagelliforme CCNUN1]|uniref:Uncharacterized protein n=1 Tax=Nostoc flagelliforme CCNUN1 TaxID=2038116 RepID=A0A2K8SL81_9NOSO|nr:hypothetical protein COO91_01485 [Nostoc flagelliforme CCNUN1]
MPYFTSTILFVNIPSPESLRYADVAAVAVVAGCRRNTAVA